MVKDNVPNGGVVLHSMEKARFLSPDTKKSLIYVKW